ncbi:MAG: ribosome assembly cofactor RimP [Muribaculaceae bacterium]|nr:ribosome assembly cofactor RimP [Muribaculaceae bacterium]
MIDKTQIEAIVDKAIEGTDAFLVEVSVSRDNDIVVELDSPTGVDLDFCTRVSDMINAALDRDVEDYSLEVGTSSLSAPFKVAAQYEKHIGDNVDILTRDGRKFTATLTAVNAAERTFTVEVTRKVKEPGEKRPHMVTEPETLAFDDCRTVAYHFDFK